MDTDNNRSEITRLALRVQELETQLRDRLNPGEISEKDAQAQALLPGLTDEPPRRRSPQGRRRSDVMGDYVLSSMGDGVVGCNEAGEITMVNPAAIEIMQIEPMVDQQGLHLLQIPDDVGPLKKPDWFKFHAFFHDDKKTPISAEDLPLSKACRGETVRAKEIFVRQNDSRPGIWISVNAQPLIGPDGTMIGGVSVFRDITERKATEDARTRLVAIIDAAPDFIATTSAAGDLLYMNGAGRHLLGLLPDEDISQLRFVDLHPDEAISLLEKEALPTALRDGVWRGENSFCGRDNTNIPINQVIVVHRTPDKKVEFLSCISTDMTEKKTAELALARRADALARSNAELEQFAGVAAHDLQEPLRNLAGFTELLATRYKGKLDPAADEFIDQTVSGVQRMRELIRDLLGYSKVDVAPQSLSLINTEEALHNALRNLQSTIEKRNALIEHSPMPFVVANPTQLSQVFQNLIGNGIKFCDKGNARVRISASEANGGWIFCVEDNGIGIEARYLDRVFRIFERLHSRAEFSGTGIGLSVCKKLIERHGGRIWAESEPGEGSRFLFWLPSSTTE